MLKQKHVSWRDTNLALIGSDLDHKIKAAAAANEPQWVNVGKSPGLNVWRIEKFIVKPWPKSKYGKFHTGDSYVILNTYKPDPSKPKLAYDIHIWIGSKSSQDEYGTAAYKMVELDDKLGGAPVQHREVQGGESEMFLNYFRHKVTYLAGGIETGFRHVEAGEGASKEPHLFHIKGKGATLRMTQEAHIRRSALNEGDVFILTANDKVWLWIGGSANQDEKSKGMEVARALCTHGGTPETIRGTDEPESDHAEFWKLVPATGGAALSKKLRVAKADDKDNDVSQAMAPVIYTCSTSGSNHKISFRKVLTAKRATVGVTTAWKFSNMSLSSLQSKYSKNVLLLDTGFYCFVWMGTQHAASNSGATMSPVSVERAYVKQFHRPDELPLTIVKQNQETTKFKSFFTESKGGTSAGAATGTSNHTRSRPEPSNGQQQEAVGGTCKCVIL